MYTVIKRCLHGANYGKICAKKEAFGGPLLIVIPHRFPITDFEQRFIDFEKLCPVT